MGFSYDVKNEISQLKIKSKIEALLELSALAGLNANFVVKQEGDRLRFYSENPAVIKRIVDLIHYLYGIYPDIISEQNNQLQQEPIYFTDLTPPYLEDFFHASGFDIFGRLTDRPESILARLSIEKNARAYLRGAFLASGSIVDPEKSYHVELLVDSENEEIVLMHVSEVLGLSFKMTDRKDKKILYLKDSDTISDFLVDIGASQAMLKLENTKARKDLKNEINRQANAQTANYDRQIRTATRQIQAIQLVQERIGLEELSPELRQMARVRLKNPTFNLRQLGEAMEPKLSKSGVRHRLGKLVNLAKDLEKNDKASDVAEKKKASAQKNSRLSRSKRKALGNNEKTS